MQLTDFSLRRAIETRDLFVRYAATDPQQQEVEVHVFRHSVRERPDWDERVKRARLVAMVNHDAVQRIMAIEPLHDPPFVVLEPLEGPSVASQNADRNLSPSDVVQLGQSIAAGLAELHRLGVAHGRVLPSHLVLRPIRRWTLAWSMWPARSPGDDTGPGDDAEELKFIAPEQRETEDVEKASDIFALASVLQWLFESAENQNQNQKQMESGVFADPWRRLRDECCSEDPTTRPSASQLATRLGVLASNGFSIAIPIPIEKSMDERGNDRTWVHNVSDNERLRDSPDVTLETPRNDPDPIVKQLGRYEIGEKLGEGGMGAVFRGRDVADGSIVAIKVLSPRIAANPVSRLRFAKEARMLARANNPFVANLLAFDEDAGASYLAVEFVPGGSVGQWLNRLGYFPEPVAIALVADTLRGLAVAHQRGILHRDIKPDNMLLTEAGAALLSKSPAAPPPFGVPLVKLADFGLARTEQQSDSLAITYDGSLLGTPLYMSPEQCRGQSTDTRSDVYSVGATLFHLVAGRPPFDGASHVAVMNQHCQEPLPELSKLRSQISEALERVVKKSLAKNRDARYATAAEFLIDLELMQRGAPTSIGLHPRRPDTAGKQALSFEFQWDLASAPGELWPYVSNTDRVNQAMGLSAIRYTTQNDPVRGVRRFAEVTVAGQRLNWEEHPYEWVEGRKLSVLREFSSGPFRWFVNNVELQPRAGGGTRLTQTFQLLPLGLVGKWLAHWEIGRKAKKSLQRVYQQIDHYLASSSRQSPASDAFRKSTLTSAARRARLGQRLQRLIALRLDPLAIETLGQFLEHGADQEVARIRPLAFAERFGLESSRVIEVCLHAAREGLLVLLWDILCPSCRIPADVQETLAALRDHGHCAACNVDFDLDFGNSVELIFRAHPEIRPVETRTYCIGGPAFSAHVVAQSRLAPAERFELELALSDGTYRVRGPQLPFVIDFRVAPRGVVTRWEIALARPVETSLVPILQSGAQVVMMTNDTPQELLVRLERMAPRQDALTAAAASSLALFREIFPDQVLSPGQMVSLTSVTLLLARIHDSARLYRERGDGPAFHCVQQVLSLSAEEVARQGGAIVKTVGDGLMAAFNDTPAAVSAALQIMGSAKSKSKSKSRIAEVSMQAAIHTGPAMVATLNDRLDYFGHSIHIVNGLLERCEPDEMLLSDAVASLPGVAALLQQQGCLTEILPVDRQAALGIVHRVRLGAMAR